ncbi:MAG: alanine racemase [Bacteroidales bacterium]
MFRYSKIKSPTFVVNTSQVINNIENMLQGLPENCVFRPHFKTHNNSVTAKIFKNFGIDKITVSSVEMALYFRQLGFRDITIAFPVNVREQRSLNRLAKNTILGLCFSNLESLHLVSKFKSINAKAWIEINTGQNRSGIDWDDCNSIEKMIEIISKSENLVFKGFLSHTGETYSCRDKNEIIDIAWQSFEKLRKLKARFSEYSPMLSIGDTPSCSVLRNFNEIDEIRPGNFVYYDLMMLQKQVCKLGDIAASVFCPVVDINEIRNEIVIHGGSVHFGKEFLDLGGQIIFGKAVSHISNNLKTGIDENLISLSQEHGIIKISSCNIKDFHVGDLVEIIPVHVCLVANYMKNSTLHF